MKWIELSWRLDNEWHWNLRWIVGRRSSLTFIVQRYFKKLDRILLPNGTIIQVCSILKSLANQYFENENLNCLKTKTFVTHFAYFKFHNIQRVIQKVLRYCETTPTDANYRVNANIFDVVIPVKRTVRPSSFLTYFAPNMLFFLWNIICRTLNKTQKGHSNFKTNKM